MSSNKPKSATIAPAANGVLSIDLIGGLRVSFQNKRIDLKKKKAAALLVLLVFSADFRISREEARGLLWPDSDEAAAQTSLRNALWSLKTALVAGGFDGLAGDRKDIRINPEMVETDVDTILDDLDRGQPQGVLSREPRAVARIDRDYRSIPDSFARKLAEAAIHFARQVRKRLSICAESAQTDAERIAILQFIVDMDPADEGAVRDLIRGFWLSGQTANALVAYQSLWHLLEDEFGEEPSEETQALIVEVKSGGPAVLPQGDTRPRIIVADNDFTNLDPGVRQQMEILRNELCANLVRFREWQVFDAALVTDADALVTSGRRTYGLFVHATALGEKPECRAVLADRANGELLWSEDFADNSLQIPPDMGAVADRIAAALNLHLSSASARVAHASASEAGAYERWTEAQDLILRFTPHSWTQAEAKLDDLIQDFPQLSRAYSSRASIENMRQISFPGIYSTPELHLKALRLAAKAIELDPMDSRGQLAMGWSSAMSRQFDRAELAFDLAFQYNENDPWTITSSAVGLAFCDHFDAACRLLDVLFSLNFRLQSSHWSYVAATMFLGGDYENCVAASEKSDAISHDVPAWHAAALALLGRLEEAADVAREFEAIARRNWAATGPQDTSEITRWLVSGFPIRNRTTWLALRDGLRLAGMPVPDLIRSEAIAGEYRMDTGV